MNVELRIKKIKDHFNNISEEEFEHKLIKHGIEEISPMSDSGAAFYEPKDLYEQHKKYSNKSIYDEMDAENYTFDVSDGSFNEVA